MTGITFAQGLGRHKLTTIPIGKLWWSACSAGNIVSFNILSIFPRTMKVEFLGTQIDCCLSYTSTQPKNPSFLPKYFWVFGLASTLV